MTGRPDQREDTGTGNPKSQIRNPKSEEGGGSSFGIGISDLGFENSRRACIALAGRRFPSRDELLHGAVVFVLDLPNNLL